MEIKKNNEIKVKLINKETLTYQLLENAKKGDWFSLVSEVQNYIDDQTKKKLSEYTVQIRNDIYANDVEIKKIKEENKNLREEIGKLKGQNDKVKADLSLKHSEEITQKEVAIAEMEGTIKQLQEKIKGMEENQDNIIKKKEADLSLAQSKVNEQFRQDTEKQLREQLRKEITEEQEKRIVDAKTWYEDSLKAKDTEINDLNDELNKYKYKNISSKQIGENLENWILERYRDVFPLGKDDNDSVVFELKKDTVNIKDEPGEKATKSDFIFTINDQSRNVETKIILEAKSESKEKSGKQKNKDFFKKIEQDRIKKKASYAILVTELEPEKYFTIDVAPNYEKIFICRPHFYLALLMLLKSIILKENKLEIQSQSLEDASKIIQKFDEWKEKTLKASINKINTKAERSRSLAERIIKDASEIQENLNKIVDDYLNKLTQKIDAFKITKIAEKIDEINKNNPNL
ncbi:DUF2130 domain-containing protein [Mesomycoplasma ovipneumoniae]|uniref:DUF2130 domain-containing protein n=1 Tax=Mesomycoplasma ovipneumoniae TaxID=29562 RepID=UPI0028A7E0BE|nr:DUF2130 domain-containing protein [Mesomycoplasma ovipneumoniae]MDW2933226.1 DUF2130 domain-containing protein [Mesomycoplasma ovipneumoniae]WNM15558.1 DUF2130 domain-containing protein [Mesomycoplasma ovipneumoniae]